MDDTFLAGSATRRLSDQERDDAVAALHRERAAGRLDDDELADRVRRALAARTRGDLAPCFADLPEGEGPIVDPLMTAAPERPRSFAWLIAALSPFVAVTMFFITGFVFGGWTIAWLWYLLIPVAGIVSAAFGRR